MRKKLHEREREERRQQREIERLRAEQISPQVSDRVHLPGDLGRSSFCATMRELSRMARAALLMVIEARDTASTSPPTLNGSLKRLALELRRELRRLDREITVRLGVVGDDHAGERPGHVHADQDVNRSVVAVLLRHQVGRPERDAERAARTGSVFGSAAYGREVERLAAAAAKTPRHWETAASSSACGLGFV